MLVDRKGHTYKISGGGVAVSKKGPRLEVAGGLDCKPGNGSVEARKGLPCGGVLQGGALGINRNLVRQPVGERGSVWDQREMARIHQIDVYAVGRNPDSTR